MRLNQLDTLAFPRVRTRHLLVAVLFVALLLASIAASLKAGATAEAGSRIVATSIRQEILAGKISAMAADPSQPHPDTSLDALKEEFSRAQTWLESHSIGAARAFYRNSARTGLHDSMDAYLDAPAGPGGRDPQPPATVSAALETASRLHEASIRTRVALLQRAEHVTLGLVLALATAELLVMRGRDRVRMARRFRDITTDHKSLRERNRDLEGLARKLEHAAHHDQLTGLANRQKLYGVLSEYLERNRPVCVMHVDLDRFKEVNDTLGHPVGDEVLRSAAETMSKAVRSTDLVARIGGDEFVIVILLDSNCPRARLQATALAIIERLRQPILVDGHECSIGASIGYAVSSEPGTSGQELIANADIALYEAKRGGKGIAIPFCEEMRKRMELQRAMSRDLHRGLENDQFVPFYQPIVSLEDGKIAGLEVLARWAHPDRGILSTRDFRDIAEETRVIDAIDGRIILKAFEDFIELQARGWNIPTISFNASTRILRDPCFSDQLLSLAEMNDVPFHRISVEIPEMLLMEETSNQAIRTIRQLSENGVSIFVDDFGTGFASLSKLMQMRLAGIKIDNSLIQGLPDPRSTQIVKAIIGMARNIGLKVIAEGVENPSQIHDLRLLGCSLAQGFSIGVPLAGDALCDWLLQADPLPQDEIRRKISA